MSMLDLEAITAGLNGNTGANMAGVGNGEIHDLRESGDPGHPSPGTEEQQSAPVIPAAPVVQTEGELVQPSAAAPATTQNASAPAAANVVRMFEQVESVSAFIRRLSGSIVGAALYEMPTTMNLKPGYLFFLVSNASQTGTDMIVHENMDVYQVPAGITSAQINVYRSGLHIICPDTHIVVNDKHTIVFKLVDGRYTEIVISRSKDGSTTQDIRVPEALSPDVNVTIGRIKTAIKAENLRIKEEASALNDIDSLSLKLKTFFYSVQDLNYRLKILRKIAAPFGISL